MLSMQLQASSPTRLSRLDQTTLDCAVARADFHRRHGAIVRLELSSC
jgi:hypothetical protein